MARVGPQSYKKNRHKYTDSIIFVIRAYEEQEGLRKRGEFGHMGQKLHLLIWRLQITNVEESSSKSATIATYACLQVNLCLPNFWAAPVPEIVRYVVHLNSK
jgi:hypothetical protein